MSRLVVHAPEPDRSRANTWPLVNETIDREAQLRIRHAASTGSTEQISERIEQLNQEWDLDRVIEAESALTGLVMLGLAVTVDRRLLALPAFVASMIALHGIYGWYPLLPVLRRLKIRTRNEIDRERYALKALRGDFSGVVPHENPASQERAAAAWAAACA